MSVKIVCCLLTSVVLLGPACVTSQKMGVAIQVYQWSTLELDWPSEQVKNEAMKNGSYIPEKNLIAGIKVYKDQVYVTVPRWQTLTGIPLTLAKVVTVGGQAKLSPYPDWGAQTIGDCKALQYVQSMEIDPKTGLMYVIDTGRVGLASSNITAQNLCPAKIVVYDLKTNLQTMSYDIPADVVSRDRNFINDIVLDYVSGVLRYAYISDVMEEKLHVFDFKTRSGWNLEDPASMKAEANGAEIEIDGQKYSFKVGIDGIAMSPDFKFVYYCPLGGYNLYQVPTSTLRENGSTSGIRLLGKKVSQSDGLAYSSRRLYYGALGMSGVYSWDPKVDMMEQGVPIDQVKLFNQRRLVHANETMQWPDTFAFDGKGWLWFVSNRLHLFSQNKMDFSGSEVNMRIWKVFIGENGYLHEDYNDSNGASHIPLGTSAVFVVCLNLILSICHSRGMNF